MEIIEQPDRQDHFIWELVVLWEQSVRTTHHFLSREDIEQLRPFVVEAIQQIETLCYIPDENGHAIAFMGIQGDKLEMLFVHPLSQAQRIGKKLVEYAKRQLGIGYVDVNEQNFKAQGFYEHLGFHVFARSEQDGQGNLFPILHMKC